MAALNADCGNAMASLKIVLLLLIAVGTAEGVISSFSEFQFTLEPTDTIVVANQPARLDCSAVGPGPPKIKWKRDGEFLQFPDFNDRRRLLSNGSLYFSTVYHSRNKRPDEGLYQCVAVSDEVGTIVSRTAKMTVSGVGRFESEPVDTTVFLGQTAVFECHAPATPPVLPTWYRDGHPLVLDHGRMNVVASGALSVRDVRLGDRGQYHCVIRLEDGQQQELVSREAELSLDLDMDAANTPRTPNFILLPKNTRAEVGETVSLDCAANGYPGPDITWLKDGATIDLNHLDSRHRKIGAGSLEIRDLVLEDAGTYQCRAENSEDSVDASTLLEVWAKPHFKKTPKNADALVKADIELECEVDGQPEPVVQWYKNGDLIIQSNYFQLVHGTNLKILGLVELDSGVYQCVASNAVGNVQAAAQLRVHQKGASSQQRLVFVDTPPPPTQVKAVIVSTRFITLSWKKPEDLGNGPIQGYSVFYKQKGSERERVLNSTRGHLEELNVQGLQPGTAYIFRVVAHNQHGVGQSSKDIEVSTQAKLDVPGPVRDLSARATSSFSILINWGLPAYSSRAVTKYQLYYREADSVDVRSANVSGSQRQYHLTDLREYTEYTFWLSAFNTNGEGAFSTEIVARTMSDIPADPPENVTLEADSASSLILRWEPPPKESQNGVITGYKIRWRAKAKGKTEVVTTDGSRRLFAIAGLQNGKEYQVRISALTVNGSGPATPWMSERTFLADLDESVVPDPPTSLRAKAKSGSISISWTPPKENAILVRGYTIGWGKGIPDEYTKVVDNKQRDFDIKNLKANSEYVISLRAYNTIGDGRPIYETIRTKEKDHEEFSTPLKTPYGLFVQVLSSKTALVTWMDSSLPRNQVIPDDRNYIVRYTTVKSLEAGKPRHQYGNATELNLFINDLRPFTAYEFTVKVVNGRRQSQWSMVTINKTMEAPPSSPPRDLSIRSQGGQSGSAHLSWRPPKQPNGRINGYVIQYSDDRRAEEHEWAVEAIVGDATSATITGLRGNTKYFFKLGARNSKGYGPYGLVSSFLTPPGPAGAAPAGAPTMATDSATVGSGSQPTSGDPESVSPVILYAVAGVGAGICIVVLVGAVLVIQRCSSSVANSPSGASDRHNKSYLNGEVGAQRDKLNPQGPAPPPDLWIGHDQLELKVMDGDETGETSIARSTPVDVEYSRSASSMDRSRNYLMPYSGPESEVSFCTGRGSSSTGPGSSAGQVLTHHLPHPQQAGGAGGHHQQKLFQQQPPPQCSQQQSKIAAINGKPRVVVHRYLSRESVASSLPSSSCNGSSSTYIRSGLHLNPPPTAASTAGSSVAAAETHPPQPGSPGDLPPPGYEASDGPPSTIDESASCWANTTASSIDGGSQVGGINGITGISGGPAGLAGPGGVALQPVAPPTLPPTYLSSAMSTSSADSSSAGSGHTQRSGSKSSHSGSNSSNGLKSFSAATLPAQNHMHIGQPKNIVRPTPGSPFKRPLLCALPGSTSNANAAAIAPLQKDALFSTTGDHGAGGTPLHSGLLPCIADVRSPDVLRMMPSLSTEELNAEMKNLEGLMKDLGTISKSGAAAAVSDPNSHSHMNNQA